MVFFHIILPPPRYTLFPNTTLFFFFFNDTATTEIYTLSLHDALPICPLRAGRELHVVREQSHRPVGVLGTAVRQASRDPEGDRARLPARPVPGRQGEHRRDQLHPGAEEDRKSTRLNSSHTVISYAVFC